MSLQSIIDKRKQLSIENRRDMRIRLNNKELELVLMGLIRVKPPRDKRVLTVLKKRLMELVKDV